MPHIEPVATMTRKKGRVRSSAETGRTIVYRGIKIKLPPMSGKRSPTAEAIRDALDRKYSQPRGKTSLG
jgi:hypothetical protein